ncbi:preprotein translocase subunit SecG [bacterium]|nr:preprotein translocase subunit SecG [bacterium]
MANLLWYIATGCAVLLILLILMHSPKGDGIGGIGGASHIFASQKSAEKGLNNVTGICCAIFIICSFVIGLGIIK